MYRAIALSILALLAAAPATAQATPAAAPATSPLTPQIRGFWVDGFNPGIKSREEVDTLLARLQRAGCNAVFAQVRKRGDAYYFSRYEPLAVDNRTGFDPLRYLIERAHQARPRIAVHAWINTAAVGSPAFDPGHILARNPSWRSVSDTGEGDDREAIKIDLGVPEAAEWTYRVYMDVARSYPVDGIHFDFVRYGGAKWGYAPRSVARFNARYRRHGLPAWDDPLWQQWRRDQVTALVRKVYANAVAVRPAIVVSAALIAWGDAPKSEAEWTKSSAYSAVYQDWRAWLDEGILDLACPMTYFAAARHRSFQENWAEWIKTHPGRRAATIAVGTWLNTLPETLDLLRISQAPSASGRTAAGVLFYSYRGTSAGGSYDEVVYDTLGRALTSVPPFPLFPWKSHAAMGNLKGNVLTGSRLDWADGATVTLEGAGMTRTQTADGTGFFAFVDLPPGRYRLHAAHDGETSTARTIEVAAGETDTVNYFLSSGDLPAPQSAAAINREKAGTRARLSAGVVTIGMDVLNDRFYIVDHVGGTPLLVRAPKDLVLPIVRDDVVTLTGAIRIENGQRIFLADAVQVVGSRRL